MDRGFTFVVISNNGDMMIDIISQYTILYPAILIFQFKSFCQSGWNVV